jgi:glycosyltransferase involved in cell wall biosynthesis
MPNIIQHIDLTLLIVGEFWEGEDEYREQIKKLGVKDKIRIINKYVPNEDHTYLQRAVGLFRLPLAATSR